MAIPFALIGRAQSYGITVRLDETTSGDLDVIATSIGNTSVGAEVQRSVRRLATSAAGEMALLANQRFANGTLTLDDGSAAPLAAGDQITVVREGEALGTYVNAHGATMQAPVKRVILIPDPDSSTMKPYAILILANNTCRRVLVHPSATCRALRNVTAGDWSIADASADLKVRPTTEGYSRGAWVPGARADKRPALPTASNRCLRVPRVPRFPVTAHTMWAPRAR